MEGVLQSGTVAEWEMRLEQAGVAVAPVNTMDRVFQGPHVLASGQVTSISHPTVGDVKMVGPAVEYSLTPAEVRTPPPLLGEHTGEVLIELLGASSQDLARWAADGVI